jgi:hypothetical protein
MRRSGTSRGKEAAAVIWKMLVIAQSSFRKMNMLDLLKPVHLGAEYEDRIEITRKKAAT